jgi:hypothetical protein
MRLFYSTGVILAVVLGSFSVPAHAGIILDTHLFDGLVGSNTDFGYNSLSLGAGALSIGGCPNNPTNSCSLSVNVGTNVGGTNATSGTYALSMTGSTPADPRVPVLGFSVSGSAFATANLAAGTVGVADAGVFLDSRFPNSGQNGGTGRSFAQAADGLHFIIAGAGGNTVTFITVTFAVDGGMTVPTASGDSHGFLQSIFGFGTAAEETDVNLDVQSGFNAVLKPVSAGGWASSSLTGNPGNFIFTGTYALVGSTVDLGFQETLTGDCGLGTSCDYSHTGGVTFGLPGNVSFTSDSGVFLTQSPASGAVPEPGSFGLMAIGVAGLVLVGRKYARARA